PSHGNFLAFTPVAKSLLLNKESKLWLLDVETGQISKQLGASASAGVFSTDGKVLTVVESVTIRRLDLATGKTLSAWQFRQEPPQGFDGGLGGTSSLESRLSADGVLVAMLETYDIDFKNVKQTL